MDEMFATLPFMVRIKMILNWAGEFTTNKDKYLSDHLFLELIQSITILDLSHFLEIDKAELFEDVMEVGANSHFRRKRYHSPKLLSNDKKPNDEDGDGGARPLFANLIHLPFSSSLTHLDLSKTPIGKSDICMKVLSHPIFQHLETLDLSETNITNIDQLFNAPHPFPNLRTLNLSNNPDLSIPQIATTIQFPNLQVLDISNTKLDTTTLNAFGSTTTSTISQPTPTPQPAPFQLEKLSISTSLTTLDNNTMINNLSQSPHLHQLKELRLCPPTKTLSDDMIKQLFGTPDSVLKNLTCLDLGQCPLVDYSALGALGQSPLLTNLTTLTLSGPAAITNTGQEQTQPTKDNGPNQSSIQQFINSPFLWGPQLKHLTLTDMPRGDFVFDNLIPVLDGAKVQLESLNLTRTESSFGALASSSSCLSSSLKHFSMGYCLEQTDKQAQQAQVDLFTNSPLLSNLQNTPFNYYSRCPLTLPQFISLLSSPMMSNDVVDMDLTGLSFPLHKVIKTISTLRINPSDKSSPLKFAKLQKLNLSGGQFGDSEVKSIVGSFKELTHLYLGNQNGKLIDKAITHALVATERANPYYLQTSLPKLTHLDISTSSILEDGCQALTTSQLFNQLIYFDGNECDGFCPMEQGLGECVDATLCSTLVSKLKYMDIGGYIFDELDDYMRFHLDLKKCLSNCVVLAGRVRSSPYWRK